MARLRIPLNACLCKACGRDFTSVSSFDLHRIGHFREGSRRCMTDEELLGRHMELKPSGRWGWQTTSWYTRKVMQWNSYGKQRFEDQQAAWLKRKAEEADKEEEHRGRRVTPE